MTTPTAPSMNAMVDSITDAVESAIHHGQVAEGLRWHMLQGAVRRALKDIHDRRIPPRRLRVGGQGGRRSSPCPLPNSPGICPNHGPAMFVRRTTVAPTPLQSPMPPMQGTGGDVSLDARRPPFANDRTGGETCPLSFAYDFDVVLPPPLHRLEDAPTPM
ncbi:hypothetical protein PVAP13_8NG195001 [Panicum virgatum]|uniref:Uncharacterized protein n=1 Tax=Panicum virgatum TaxID=38727 RepID=A0A8T0P4T2_PANVG|nr:hypothetical protein PVAP13_8NG195001 [Panicum virgatum]